MVPLILIINGLCGPTILNSPLFNLNHFQPFSTTNEMKLVMDGYHILPES